jgi:hypothetical protein
MGLARGWNLPGPKTVHVCLTSSLPWRHQRKREFVKWYGEIFLLLVLLVMAWEFLLRVTPVSAGARFGA